MEQQVQFTSAQVSIFDNGTKEALSTDTPAAEGQPQNTTISRPTDDARLGVQLWSPPVIPTYTQVKVVSKPQRLCVLEPKHAFSKYKLRATTSIHDVLADTLFSILLSNFSAQKRSLPKNTAIALAARPRSHSLASV